MLPFLPLASLAVLWIRLSRGFRNEISKWLHSRNSSPAVFISPGLLSGSSPKHLKPAPPTLPHKSRVWLFVLPHIKTGDTVNTLNRSLQRVERIWGPLLTLRRLRGKGPDARGLRQVRTSLLEAERLTPHFTVPVSLRCPQETNLSTLPHRVLQGAVVSGERISQGPPGNVVASGCPPPLRRVSERSAQMLPAGSPCQDDVLTAQIHTNPETNLERLVPLVEFLTAWKLLPNIPHWVLQTIEKGYQMQFRCRPPRCFVHRGGPPAGSGNGTGNKSSVRERGHRICTSLQQGNRVLQPVFYSSKEGWRFASHFRSSSSERIMQLKFKMLTLRQIVSQIKSEDFFCHDRSQGRILSHIHPSMSQEVPEVRFWGQSIPVSSSSVRPSIITPHIHEMRRCSPGTSSASGYSH